MKLSELRAKIAAASEDSPHGYGATYHGTVERMQRRGKVDTRELERLKFYAVRLCRWLSLFLKGEKNPAQEAAVDSFTHARDVHRAIYWILRDALREGVTNG